MTRCVAFAALVIWPIAGCATPVARLASDPRSDEAAIRRVLQEAVAAHHAGNAARWAALVASDVVVMLEGQPAIVGRDSAARFVRDFFAQNTSTLDARVVEVQVAGDWAFVRTEDRGAFTPKAGGPPMPIDFKELIVFRRQADGSWKAARIMVNSNRPPAGAR